MTPTPKNLAAAGFTVEPDPDWVLLRVERCRHQPKHCTDVGQVRVRRQMRSGGWEYFNVEPHQLKR